MIITLVGFQYHNTNDYISSLSTGYSFKLKRDESNDFDNKAIGVYDNDRLVAYVKREDAHNLWNSVIDELSCTIIEDFGNTKKAQVIYDSNINEDTSILFSPSHNRDNTIFIKSTLAFINILLAIWAGTWATDGLIGETILSPVIFIIVFVIVGFPALGWFLNKMQERQEYFLSNDTSKHQFKQTTPQQNGNYNINSSNSQDEIVQCPKYRDLDTPKRIERDFEISETNFFGINLYECPNEEWAQVLESENKEKTEYLYQKDDIKCTLKVTKSIDEKSFIFNIPYSYENYLNLGYCIEKNIIKKKNLIYGDYIKNHELDLEDLQSEGRANIAFDSSEHMIAFIAKPPIIIITFWLNYHKRSIQEDDTQRWKENDFRINLIEKNLEEGYLVYFSQNITVNQSVPTQLMHIYQNKKRFGLTEDIWNKVLNYLENAKYAVLDPYNPDVFSETKSIAYNLIKGDEELDYLNSELFEIDNDDWYSSHLQGEILERSRYLYSKTTIKYNLIGGEYFGFDILNVIVLNRFSLQNMEEVQPFLTKKKEELYNAELFESFLKDNKIAYSKFKSEDERLRDDLIGMF